jgi:hypothetical protein
MTHFMPHVLKVSAMEPTAACASISGALRQAAAGDTVLVSRGRYAPQRRESSCPCMCHQASHWLGQGVSIIDGAGAMDLSFHPVQAGQSLIVLGDGTPRHTIRVIGGVGFGGYAAQRKRVRVTLSCTRIAEAGEVPILLQGGISEGQETVTDNAVMAQRKRTRQSPTRSRPESGVPRSRCVSSCPVVARRSRALRMRAATGRSSRRMSRQALPVRMTVQLTSPAPAVPRRAGKLLPVPARCGLPA